MTSNNFTMPAEWEKHVATWLNWPHYTLDWPAKFGPIPWAFSEMGRYISYSEKLRLIVKNKNYKAQALKYLEKANANMDNVEIYEIPTNRGWMRDSGPIFVKNKAGEKAFCNFRFNAWAKYKNHKFDNQVPTEINKHFKLKEIVPMHKGKQVVMEGGALDVNGKGTILVTEECLQSPIQERNPGFTKDDYAEVFSKYLGAPDVIWLENGIAGDDTHGHVDDITRFVNSDTIVTVVESNKKEVNYKHLQENLKRLKRTKCNIIELPMPKPVLYGDFRLPASYGNFLITNKYVMVPTFNDPNDRIALNVLAECFPKREVVGIHALDLVLGQGTIHCLTQQEPA